MANRRRRRSHKRRAEAKRRCAFLRENLRLLVFTPSSAAAEEDNAKHELLLRAAGLWGVARLSLHRPLRPDLLAPLIASYSPDQRRALVHSVPVTLRRVDFSRAFAVGYRARGADLLRGEEAVEVIIRFVLDWMLREQDAGGVLPPEAVAAVQMVREGSAHHVDWGEMMRAVVERDIMRARSTGECRYAAYLQCLLRHQHPMLFGGRGPPQGAVIELDAANEKDDFGRGGIDLNKRGDREEEEQDGASDRKKRVWGLVIDLNECGDQDKEEKQDVSSYPKKKVWTVIEVDADDRIEKNEDTVDNRESRGGDCAICLDDTPLKSPALQRRTFKEFLSKDKETIDVPDDTPPMKSCDQSHKKFLAVMEPIYKRKITEIIADEDEDVGRKKRMQTGERHEEALKDSCIDEARHWMGKGEMMFEGKEQDGTDARLELQQMKEMLQEKDRIIRTLEKAKLEEQKKRKKEFCWYKHEVNVMSNLVHGYKKALGQTRNAFAEYRKKYPQGDEPLYRDVDGTGGLVLSTWELRRKQIKEGEEGQQMHKLALEKIHRFQNEWLVKFHNFDERLQELFRKLLKLEIECKFLT